MAALMYSHVHTSPPSISGPRPELENSLSKVVRKAMSKKPGERYQSATQLAEAARAALDDPEPRATARSPASVNSAKPLVRDPTDYREMLTTASESPRIKPVQFGAGYIAARTPTPMGSGSNKRKKMYVIGTGVVVALSLLLVGTTGSSDYAAIAYSNAAHLGKFGFGPDKLNAINAAVANCNTATQEVDCAVFLWFADAWGSLAQATGGQSGFGWASSRDEAEHQALEQCRAAGGAGCQVVMSETTDNHPNQ
jgi:hypothetical protein